MPDSIYDKLGDLLNDALESGKISEEPVFEKKEEPASETQTQTNNEFTGCDSSETLRDNSTLFRFKRTFFRNKKIETGEVIKGSKLSTPISFPPQIVQALQIFGITDYSKITKSYIRKTYLQLIKKVHPDTNTNGTDQNEKTQNIIQAYKILTEYFK